MGVVTPDPVRRGDVFLVSLNPTVGGEIQKSQLCLVVFPNELNENLRMFIMTPLTTGGHPYPFRIPCHFHERNSFVVLDQIRTIDRDRLVQRLGKVPPAVLEKNAQGIAGNVCSVIHFSQNVAPSIF
jgi:mRNA interferase MazF